MNILLIGQNLKMAGILSNFSNVSMVVERGANYRSWAHSENNQYSLIKSQTKISSPFAILKRSVEICKWVKRGHIDVIFTNEKYSMIAAKIASLFLKKKLILLSTSHSSYAWQNPKKVKQFARIIDITTDGYIALASFVHRALLDNGVNKNKLLLQPNAIEYDTFLQKNNYDISEVLKLTYVAVVYPQKGQDVLLKAVKMLEDNGLKVHVDLYGDVVDAEYKKSLDKFIAENEIDVVFKGSIGNDELKNILSKYDIYVSPSLMEMSPLNILEAKAAALPVIANDVGGIVDLISNGRDGILIEPNNPKILSEAISSVAEDVEMRKMLGKNAYISVSTKLSPQESVSNIKKFIQSL